MFIIIFIFIFTIVGLLLLIEIISSSSCTETLLWVVVERSQHEIYLFELLIQTKLNWIWMERSVSSLDDKLNLSSVFQLGKLNSNENIVQLYSQLTHNVCTTRNSYNFCWTFFHVDGMQSTAWKLKYLSTCSKFQKLKFWYPVIVLHPTVNFEWHFTHLTSFLESWIG